MVSTKRKFLLISVIKRGSNELLACSASLLNTLRPRQNGRHFADDIFKWIFLNKNVWISINISLKFVPMGPNNNIPTLVQVMAWRRSGDKPLFEPMMVGLPTHICVTRPQWVNDIKIRRAKSRTLGKYLSHLLFYFSKWLNSLYQKKRWKRVI